MRRLLVVASFVALLVLVVVRHADADQIAHWELDGNGDDSVNGHDGTVYGATATTDRFGNANSALLFNGSSDYIAVPHHADLSPPNAMTVSAWFKSNYFNPGPFTWPAVVKKANDGTFSGYGIEVANVPANPETGFFVYDGTNALGPGGFLVETDTWYFVAGIYDYNATTDVRTLTTFFGDQSGVLESKTTDFAGPMQQSTIDLNIGRDPYYTGSNRHFNGVIDDVRIYNEALTSQQVNGLYTVPEPSTVVSLIGLGIMLTLTWVHRRRKQK